MNAQVQSGSADRPMDVDAGRVLRSRRALSFGVPQSPDAERTRQRDVSGNGLHLVAAGKLVGSFVGTGEIHKLKVARADAFIGNGLSCRLQLSGWRSVKQLLLGFVHDGKFRRCTVPHPRQDRAVVLSCGLHDLIFAIQNGWPALGSGPITDLHFHVQGVPGEHGASIEIDELQLWQEVPRDFRLSFSESQLTFSELVVRDRWSDLTAPLRADLFAAFDPYLRRFFADLEQQADAFMSRGEAPSYRASLPWASELPLPSMLAENNSYRWSWHGLHAVVVLTTSARWSGDSARLFAARSFLEAWLERSYYRVDEDQKYCWYDQGVADRLYALVLIWDAGVRLGFDRRFQSRVLEALSSHMRLLASEAFYSSHQETRYHNHAVFQDLALMFASLAVPEIVGAQDYFATAAERLGDQLENILIHEQDVAILIENSVSYHVGFQDLIDFADRLMRLSSMSSPVPALAEAMRRFTSLVEYPDKRLVGHGDSPRAANSMVVRPEARAPYATPEMRVLRKVGQAVVKGNHAGSPFMLSVFATSLGTTHKHEDNLSFTLYFDGIEWLIDPSFYCYEPSSALANYLRSAPAHNALVVPGAAYSIAAGLAELDGARDDVDFVIRGRHSAYGSVDIEREIRGCFEELALHFEERLVATGSALPERALLMLHCGDGVAVTLSTGMLTLRHPASRFELAVRLPTTHARLLRDHEDEGELRGVTGLGFMARGPITTIECTVPPGLVSHWEITALSAAKIGEHLP